MVREQQKDEIIREIVSRKNWGHPDESPNLPLALRKNREQINHLVVENDNLFRLFYDESGEMKCKQFCVSKTLCCEDIFRLHNSKTVGHFCIAQTVEEFRQRFYFPKFTDFLLSSGKNCLTCLQLKRVPSKFLETSLQPVSFFSSYPGEANQIDLFGPLQALLHCFVSTAMGTFFLFNVFIRCSSKKCACRHDSA